MVSPMSLAEQATRQMSQITVYMDKETQARMKAAAHSAGMSVSRWLASLVQEKTASAWPSEVLAAAGAWKDFPELTELRGALAAELAREQF
jgi:hypothetical protein